MTENGHSSDSPTAAEQIHALAEPVAADFGVDLIDVQFRRETAGWVLSLVIDKPGGVTVDDCASVSYEVGAVLELEDFIEHAFTLEVSSPGLDRPLKKRQDFERVLGQKVRIVLHEPVQGEQVVSGELTSVEDTGLTVAGKNGAVHIGMTAIARARLDF